MFKMRQWLNQIGWDEWKIEVASEDASFRSYYRLRRKHDPQSYVLMDSSRLLESLPPFVEMNERLSAVDVHVPKIIAQDLQKGYLILEDFGNTHYLDMLNEENERELYQKAIGEIRKMQKAETSGLPLYDKDFLHFEMALMQEWYLEKYLGLALSAEESAWIEDTVENVAHEVMQQPQGVFVHRDFHSRNIMLTPRGEIGIIDFQDARSGGVTYDLVSLLRDVYAECDREEVERLALYFRDAKGLDVDDATFIRWFDFTGLQRHIKILGIFARLALRDGKEGYLKDIPMTLKYVVDIGGKYPETRELSMLLKRLQNVFGTAP